MEKNLIDKNENVKKIINIFHLIIIKKKNSRVLVVGIM
jgi:hypothetical protein